MSRGPFGAAWALLGATLALAAPVRAQAPRPATAVELLRAEQLARSGRPAEALALYRLVGENAATQELRATGWLRASRMVGDAAVAESNLRRAAEVDTAGVTGAQALLELGQLYYARGNYRAADQCLARCQVRLSKTPDAPSVLLFRARVAMGLRVPGEAAVAYEAASHGRPQAQRGLYGWGQALMAAGNSARALECFDRYAASYPAGDFLAGALAAAARSGERSGKLDRAAASRARLGLAAPASFEAQDLPPAPAGMKPRADAAPLPRGATRPQAEAPRPARLIPQPPSASPSPRREAAKPLPAAPQSAANAREPWYIQLGLFSQSANARTVLNRARAAGLEASLDSAGTAPGRYRVLGSSWPTREQATAAARRYQAAGLPTQLKPGGP
ncbi:MAG: SPOR domain-containing protein [Candidatus Eisenbacteria bacterium]|nr:SPOR domain-containing protein [Candidatus Eisenbacteria bacterium]